MGDQISAKKCHVLFEWPRKIGWFDTVHESGTLSLVHTLANCLGVITLDGASISDLARF